MRGVDPPAPEKGGSATAGKIGVGPFWAWLGLVGLFLGGRGGVWWGFFPKTPPAVISGSFCSCCRAVLFFSHDFTPVLGAPQCLLSVRDDPTETFFSAGKNRLPWKKGFFREKNLFLPASTACFA